MTNGLSGYQFSEQWMCVSNTQGTVKINTIQTQITDQYSDENIPFRLMTDLLPGVHQNGTVFNMLDIHNNVEMKILFGKATERYIGTIFFKFYTDDWLNAIDKINPKNYLIGSSGVYEENIQFKDRYYYFPGKIGPANGVTQCLVHDWAKREMVLNYLYLYMFFSLGIFGIALIYDVFVVFVKPFFNFLTKKKSYHK